MNRCDKLRQYIMDNEAVYVTSYPNIFYYSGFDSEDGALIITKTKQLLLTDSRYTVQAREQAPDFDVADISGLEEIIKALKEEVLCFEEDFVTVRHFARLQKCTKKLKPFAKTVSLPRRVKDSEEIKKIAAAEALGDEAFSYILDFIKPGRTEIEIAVELEMYMRKRGASALSFETICASGVRSCMPHAKASQRVIEKGDLLTLDFGCILDGYCSDMTRTVAIGSINDKQKEIYDTVLKAQKTVIEMLKSGVKCSDGDKAARDVIKNAGFGEYFGHATGHSVGIEIHEEPNLSPKSSDILETGNVVSVEPGIYIDGFCGVRIEDLVQITSENVINLTKTEKDLLII